MNELNSVSILGCGWLGFPLAQKLLSLCYRVKGSTTSSHKLNLFEQAGIKPFQLHFSGDGQADQNLVGFLESDLLVIAIPPGRTEEGRNAYRSLVKTLGQLIPQSAIKQLILVSSTSVYGEPKKEVDEDSEPQPTETGGRLMWEVEQELASFGLPYTVVRLGGLIGPDRHPGRFFAGKKNIPNGLAPVNLIHLKDAVGVLVTIIQNQYTGIFNGCAPQHPSRSEFYTSAALDAGLEPPEFLAELLDWKRVKCKRLEELQFAFSNPNLTFL